MVLTKRLFVNAYRCTGELKKKVDLRTGSHIEEYKRRGVGAKYSASALDRPYHL